MANLTSKLVNAIPVIGVINFMSRGNLFSLDAQFGKNYAKFLGHTAYNFAVAIYVGAAIQTGSLNPIEQTRVIHEQVVHSQAQNPSYKQ